jgi:uncharacterized damage-inducible protein DinB
MSPEQAKVMAEYNKWMNEKVYQACAGLPDEELKRDRSAFFKSIHGTLNHILLGDKVWFGRFTGNPFKAQSLDQILHTDFVELRKERELLDKAVCAWASELTAARLNAEFRWVSMLSPAPRRCPFWVAIAHFFNHQTHHRGQITTLLTQSNIDVGVTDLLMLPGLVSIEAA